MHGNKLYINRNCLSATMTSIGFSNNRKVEREKIKIFVSTRCVPNESCFLSFHQHCCGNTLKSMEILPFNSTIFKFLAHKMKRHHLKIFRVPLYCSQKKYKHYSIKFVTKSLELTHTLILSWL